MGKDWENKIEYIEVKKPSLLTYKHSGEKAKITTSPFQFHLKRLKVKHYCQ
jgi:hypothetical protein